MEVKNKIFAILSELSGMETITLEQDLQNDLLLDSLHMVSLLMMLEDDFEIVLNESDMNPYDLSTVQNVVDLIEKYESEKRNEAKEDD